MNSTFDTLTALRSLEASGLDSGHAEAIVQVVSQSHEQVATKGDVSGLQNEFSTFHEETRAEFVALRNDMDDGFAAVSKEFVAVRKEVHDGFAAVRKEMNDGFVAVRKEMDDGLAAVRKDMGDGFAAIRKEWKDEFAAFRTEVENRFAIQDGKFQVALSRTANKMLVAQVAVGGLVVAVLSLL